jgi:hypothetical protein
MFMGCCMNMTAICLPGSALLGLPASVSFDVASLYGLLNVQDEGEHHI